MSSNVTSTFTAIITSQTDADSAIPINRGTGNPSYNENYALFETYIQVPSSTLTIAVPLGKAFQFYFKNIDPANFIELLITPVTPVIAVNVGILGPGDQFVYWCNPINAGVGIGAVQAVCVNGPPYALAEYFIGG